MSDLLPRDPIEFFNSWYAEAVAASRAHAWLLPESATLATATKAGKPSARLVLVKRVDDRGFVFYTHYSSRKGRELAANPRAALTYHWPVLERQVRVEGRARKATRDESAAYFATRPRGSQLGAWASRQSRKLAARDELDLAVREVEKKFAGREVPCPPEWGGYRLEPESIEFWQGRADRLHDRLLYVRKGKAWKIERLAP